MNLHENLIDILSFWRPVFSKKQSFLRAVHHCLIALVLCGRKTISQIICGLGQDQQDWSAHYKLYSKRKWETKNLFQPIIEKSLPFCTGQFISIAVDDTKLPKTGTKIPSTSWHRDPMGPKFRINLIWGQRFLHFTMLLPLYKNSTENIAPRSIPIRFIDAPSAKKPSKKATAEEIANWKIEKEKRNLSLVFLEQAKGIRDSLDEAGAKDKIALFVGDGSFCNRKCMSIKVDRVEMIARCRKDAKLCFAAKKGSKRFYSKETFTPEQVRQDDTIPWKTEKVFHGGCWRDLDYKEIKNIFWPGGTKRKPLRLIVLRPVKYHVTKKGKAYYRQPGYLLCTDVTSEAKELIQPYFDRWQIEVNHREEKSILGVGQAQVRSAKSVERQPALLVAAYAALLLASVITYNDKIVGEIAASLPKWHRKAKRPSFRQLVTQLRKEMLEQNESKDGIGKVISLETFARKIAA